MVVIALAIAALAIVVVLLFLRTRRLEDHAKQLREDIRGLPSDDDIATMVQDELRHAAVMPPPRRVRFDVPPTSSSAPPTPSPSVDPDPDPEPENAPEVDDPPAAELFDEPGNGSGLRLVPDGAEVELHRAESIPVPRGAESPVKRPVAGESGPGDDAPLEMVDL